MKRLLILLLVPVALWGQAVGGGSSGGASSLEDLTDTTITSATTDDVIKYNGSAWINVNLLTAVAQDLANSGCILYESSGGIGCLSTFTFDGTSMTIGSPSATFLTAEGATADAFETSFAVTDPTADRTWTFPDATDTVVGLATAQTFATGTKTVTSKFDFGGGTLEAPNSTTLPGTCAVGEVYFDSDATAGSNLYGCTATNTWTLLGGGGASSLVYSCVTSTDNTTPGATNETHFTCTIPANTLSVGDFCRWESRTTFTDDGDVTGTWLADAKFAGTQITWAASRVNNQVSVHLLGGLSVDSSTVIEYQTEGWDSSSTSATAHDAFGTVTTDITGSIAMTWNAITTGGAGDTGDTITFKNASLQCWTND